MTLEKILATALQIKGLKPGMPLQDAVKEVKAAINEAKKK